MTHRDECLAHPELYRDRLECSLAVGRIHAAAAAAITTAALARGPRNAAEQVGATLRTLLVSLALCAGLCLAHSVRG